MFSQKNITFANKTTTMKRTGIFVGSFDPFTIGHDSVVRRALALFDHLVIGVGVNQNKRYMLSADERVEAIRSLYRDEPRISVEQGVRSVRDFEFEREQADINRRLTGIETIVLFAEPGLDSISSTVVRELTHFGHDCSSFLPAGQE